MDNPCKMDENNPSENKLLLEIQALRTEVKELTELVRKNCTVSEKMSHHIDFVENVYSTVRQPLNYVKQRFNSLTGGLTSGELPSIAHT